MTGKPMRRILLVLAFLLLTPLAALRAADAQRPARPNIILILADDLGYETVGANGGTSYRTPHLDKLAATGVRFTHCFVQPLCTPTRVQLMTYTNGEYGPDLVNDYALDFITRKKNGTGRGMRSMMGDRLVIGGKGTTTDAGMHVPLIASWPDKITAGRVCSDLVDSTDFLPTILDAAGMVTLSGVKLDGRTFLPQILGAEGQPRDWIYSWYSPRQSGDITIREFAFNRRYKLYRSGEFFDLGKDLEER